MRTTWFAVGTTPPCHVAGFDQLPLCTDRAAGRDVSSEKSGIFSGSVVAFAGTDAMTLTDRNTAAHQLSRICEAHEQLRSHRASVAMGRDMRKSPATARRR